MKQYVMLLWLCLLFECAWCQHTKQVAFADSLCSTTAQPILLHRGSVVQIACDSAYLINTVRYKMYLQLHRYIREEATAQQCQPLVDAYENALAENHIAYQNLKQQYHQCDQLSSQWITDSQQTLKEIQRTVHHTEEMVSQSGKDLDEAKRSLLSERKKHRMQKIIAGVAGIGLGLLIGHL